MVRRRHLLAPRVRTEPNKGERTQVRAPQAACRSEVHCPTITSANWNDHLRSHADFKVKPQRLANQISKLPSILCGPHPLDDIPLKPDYVRLPDDCAKH